MQQVMLNCKIFLLSTAFSRTGSNFSVDFLSGFKDLFALATDPVKLEFLNSAFS